MKKISHMLFTCTLVSGVLSGGNLLSAFLMKQLIDMPTLTFVFKLALIWLITAVILIWKKYIIEVFYLKQNKDYLLRLLKSIYSFPLLFLESKIYSDDLSKVKRMATEEQTYFVAVENITSVTVGVIGLFLLLFNKVSFNILILLCIFMLLIVFIIYIVNRNLSSLMYDYWEDYIKNTRKYKYISRVLSEKEYIEEKRTYSYFSFFLNKFEKEFNFASDKNRILGKKRIKLEFATDTISLFYSLFVFLLLFYAYLNNQISIGLFISATGYMLTLLTGLCNAIGSIEDITKYRVLKKDYHSFVVSANFI